MPKNLLIFKMRLTGLFIRMKWDNVKGTVWECTYPSGGWSWGIALRQRREFILDLLVLRFFIWLSTFKTLKKKSTKFLFQFRLGFSHLKQSLELWVKSVNEYNKFFPGFNFKGKLLHTVQSEVKV